MALAQENGVKLSADRNKLTYQEPEELLVRNNYVSPDAKWVDTPNLIYFDGGMRFDADGSEEDCLAFVSSLQTLAEHTFPDGSHFVSNVFMARQEGYGLYGGLLFLGAFFGILFLAVTVLIIYFKQISEGYEDKAQFVILQKVGMDDKQVKATINRQVLWVFFIPLGMTILHMVFASKIMARMLQTFMLYDWGLVLSCIGGVCAVFVLLYLVVYRLTAKVYYRIVKW
jgi:putative ABC transport system permease protein